MAPSALVSAVPSNALEADGVVTVSSAGTILRVVLAVAVLL